MPVTNRLLDLLAHERTRSLMGRIAQGDDPRRAVAEMAGHTLADQVAKILGAVPNAATNAAPVGGNEKVGQTTRNSTTDDVSDAEFVVIDVSPGVKKRAGKEK